MDVLPTGTHFDKTDVCPANRANVAIFKAVKIRL
jgi:hypothetical protein